MVNDWNVGCGWMEGLIVLCGRSQLDRGVRGAGEIGFGSGRVVWVIGASLGEPLGSVEGTCTGPIKVGPPLFA